MTTIEEREAEAPDHGSRKSAGGEFSRADTLDVLLLLVTILTLMGIAAGIAVGFPQALEIIVPPASAATAAASEALPRERRVQHDAGAEEEDEPLIFDDISTEGLLHAGAGITVLPYCSTPDPFGTNC